MTKRQRACPDCGNAPSEKSSLVVDRRDFVRIAGTAAVGVSAGWLGIPAVHAAPKSSAAGAETTVKELYVSLSDSQRKEICFGADHPLRRKISANWSITKPEIDSDFYSKEQRGLIDKVFREVTSEDGYDRFKEQMEYDWGGFGAYKIALFGEPGSPHFQFEMTGRHFTVRADGNSTDNVAFGGPIVYGHGEEEPQHNLFHYQTKKANEVFGALDSEQRKAALLKEAPKESQVPIQGPNAKLPGISVGELSSDQKQLVEDVIKVILAPYRSQDVEEALAVLKATGGLDQLHMAFYQEGDLASDKVWDIWRVEGPGFVWHFRGAPHVHTYVNIAKKA